MKKEGIHLYFIFFALSMIVSCEKENDSIEYYPHANQMDTIIHDNMLRTFKLHVPASYAANTKTALVIALHGYTSSATDTENGTRLSEKADAEGFIVVYPNGLSYPWTSANPQAWNAGGPYVEWTQGTDDVGFIDQMIELICKYYTIDRNQIYVTGHSNGSFMTYRLGYELSNKIAAIAAHSGQMIYMPTGIPDNKIPILHLHAINDLAVPYSGGVSGQITYSSVDDVLSHWAAWYSCSQQPDTTFQNADYMIKEWACPGSAEIKLYLLNEGGHNWFNTSNSCIEANDVIWDFFKAHPKNNNR
jgi:polyhydroxybutyrate depolymerase